MPRSVLHRLVISAVLAATLGGLAPPAAAATRPTAAIAAALTKGEVFTAAAAQHRAKKLFFLVRLPALAQLQTGAQAPGTLTPGSLDADLYTATLGHWWRTSGSVATVTAWLDKHPPVGFTVYGTGSGSGRETLLFKPISTKAGCCSTLEATIGRLGKGASISVAAFVQWQARRVPAEHVPASATTALLEVGSDPTQTVPSLPNTSVEVTGAALLPLVSTLNQLAATREVPLPCPYTPNWSKATFRYGGTVVVFASPSACPYVEVTVAGKVSQTLRGNITNLVAATLGVTPVPSAA